MGKLIIDTTGVPEFFFENNQIEDAGNGLIRIIRYIVRGGILIPVCSTVSPACSVLRLGREAEAFARKIMCDHGGANH